MKYIQTIKRLYYKNKVVGSYSFCSIVETISDDEIIKITWDNLHEIPMFTHNYGGYRETKRGKIITLETFIFFYTTIKEWKQKDTNLELVVSHRELKPSIQELLNFHDGEKAAKYLRENFELDKTFFQKTIDK